MGLPEAQLCVCMNMNMVRDTCIVHVSLSVLTAVSHRHTTLSKSPIADGWARQRVLLSGNSHQGLCVVGFRRVSSDPLLDLHSAGHFLLPLPLLLAVSCVAGLVLSFICTAVLMSWTGLSDRLSGRTSVPQEQPHHKACGS